jgi:hypothetical protein
VDSALTPLLPRWEKGPGDEEKFGRTCRSAFTKLSKSRFKQVKPKPRENPAFVQLDTKISNIMIPPTPVQFCGEKDIDTSSLAFYPVL